MPATAALPAKKAASATAETPIIVLKPVILFLWINHGPPALLPQRRVSHQLCECRNQVAQKICINPKRPNFHHWRRIFLNVQVVETAFFMM
ncbi:MULTISPECIES: hypothetical protein [unclassified Bradyrhizobium]|uniref:hypothetical protein n=1 Tax=Bradyrhizobium sp. S3.5.5 TaxID=3156430 RepID=UPI003391EDDE